MRLWGCTYSNLSNNRVHDNGIAHDSTFAYWPGIELLEGAANFHCNDVSENEGPGLHVMPQGFAYMGNGAARNKFRDNMQALNILGTDLGEIFEDNGNADLRCGENTIRDTSNAHMLIYLSPYMPPDNRDFGFNYWGTTDTNSIRSRLTGHPIIAPIMTTPLTCTDSAEYLQCALEEEYSVFFQGWEDEMSGQFAEAITQYESYLAQYPHGKYEALVIDRLLFCKKAVQWSWANIRSYFLQMAQDSSKDSSFAALCKANAAWCLIELDDWDHGQSELESLLDPNLKEYAFLSVSLKKLLAELKADDSSFLDEAAEPFDAKLERVDQALNDLLAGRRGSGGTPGTDLAVVPTKYVLYQNYPNPFNPVTTIRFDVPEATHVQVKIFNTLGQTVATLVNEDRQAGAYHVEWNASEAASGLYVYQVKAGNFVDTKKMLLLK
jgi:hypothetical protein